MYIYTFDIMHIGIDNSQYIYTKHHHGGVQGGLYTVKKKASQILYLEVETSLKIAL